ncbi:hypothetical protein ACIGZI_32280 [Streptomyces griseus]|uniref:hypothetical protein n=1 Tax=Streptomyces griseus TaxID=1911 RepID=UPI0037D2D6FE
MPFSPPLPTRGPVPGVFTAVVYRNTASGTETLTARPDDSHLRLAFLSDRVTTREAAAAAAWDVASHIGSDDNGQTWPTTAPAVIEGDIVKVTSPDHLIAYFRGESFATFTVVPEPTNLVPLDTTLGNNSR